MKQFVVALIAVACTLLILCGTTVARAAQLPFCEDVLPPGYGFGGSITITASCLWRPQVHFVSSLQGRFLDKQGALRAPVITLASTDIPDMSSGHARIAVNDVVLANFSLTDPSSDPNILWPKGLISAGSQQRKLYMSNVQMLVDAATLQQYLRFFTSNQTMMYTDNATFMHVPYWADVETTVVNFGLLLAAPDLTAYDLALSRPAPGRNFVLAADQQTLVPVLQAVAGAATPVPFLVYLSTNVSLTAPAALAGFAVNRPMFFVGRAGLQTSIDFGMQVNQLVMLGTWSHVTFSELALENLAPGDARSLRYSDEFDVLMGYHIWSALYPRNKDIMVLHNCTLVLSVLEVEEYLYKATLFKVQPAGFTAALQFLNQVVLDWQVMWTPEADMVQTTIYNSTALTAINCNYTSAPVNVKRLPLPERANDTGLITAGSPLEHSLTHVDAAGVQTMGQAPGLIVDSEVMLLTTNMSFTALTSDVAVVEKQLQEHFKQKLLSNPEQRHIMMGIVDPLVTLDMGYTTDLLTLPLDAPDGHLAIVNVVMLRLSQGPAAALPGANMRTPDVWTHLLWSIPRSRAGSSVFLSNVTVWVPAAEFSYIRSHTAVSDDADNFTIELNGNLIMRFTGVVDLRAEGLYVQHYSGPGLQADSLRIRLEAGWSQGGGGPTGFWNSASGDSGRMSDAVVVVLAVCLVTAVVASVLACLAVILWRRRTAESRLAAAALAAAELGKAGYEAAESSGGHRSSNSDHQGGSSGGPAARSRSDNGQPLRALSEPVHDSSDSYPLQERAQLRAELERGMFGATGPDGSIDNEAGGRWPSTAAGRGTANDAALQRLHSAITTMSQGVLLRRLQVAGSTTAVAGPNLARPSQQGWGGNNSPQVKKQEAGGQGSGSHTAASLDSVTLQEAGEVDEVAAGSDATAAGPLVQQRGPAVQSAVAGSGSLARSSAISLASLGELKLLQLVGQGTFGQVYKALWRRRCVAVKVLQLPATAGGSDAAPWMGVGRVSSHREKMAVMETVVSTTMSHPNIVQVYTYVLQPLMSGQEGLIRGASKHPAILLSSTEDKKQQQQQLQQQQQPQPDGEQQQQQPQAAQLLKMMQAIPAVRQEQQQHQQQQEAGDERLRQQQRQPVEQLCAVGDGEQLPAAHGISTNGVALQQQDSHPRSGSGSLHLSGQQNGSCADSMPSLPSIQQAAGEHRQLTPEMAAAAAAALPAAAAAAAAAAGGAVSVKSVKADGTGGSSNAGLGSASEGGGQPKDVLVGWELRLVMEFCDAGSLRSALDHKFLIDRTTGLPALECILFLAHDVACAMIHLHSEHLLHGDLKASNVLLKRTAPRLPVSPEQAATAGQQGRHGQLMGLGLGLMAKVADFGLSLTLGPADTHVSQMHMGTLTHMAPELLLHGRASKASDVYAYGILLWELATGRRPYSGTPVGMLAHKVAQQGWRPAWPGGCCKPVQELAEACWAHEAADRPSFEQIVAQLEEMAGQLDALKHQQAQQMAAAAAPLNHSGAGHHDVELGHELTPSMMAELMPSGFSAGSEHSDALQSAECSGVLYEMSQLSGCSQDREAHQLQQQ